MNFTLTGKKIVSTLPEKKTTQLNNKSKIQTKPKETNKVSFRKPSLPSHNLKNQPKEDKKKEQNKKEPAKVEVKNASDQIKSKEVKILQPPKLQTKQSVKIEEPPLLKVQQPKVFDILVRYNHYKDKFPTKNDILQYRFIEEKYCFRDVFKGNYLPKLQIYRNYGNYIEPLTHGKALEYSWKVQVDKEYEITIIEDEQEESKYERKIYIAPKPQKVCQLKKNQRVNELTKEMREMAVEELGSAKHRELLEQRALQQILYS